MESEIPELVALLKGIDGEVACDEKCCEENCELDHNNLSSLLKNELDNTNSEELMLYISTGVTQEDSFSNHDHYSPIDDDHVKFCAAPNKLMMESQSSFGDICKEDTFKSPNFSTKISLFQLLGIPMDDLGNGKQNCQDQTGGCKFCNVDEELGTGTRENEEEKCTKVSGNGEVESTLKHLLSSEHSLALDDDIGSCSFSAARGHMAFSGSIQSCDNISLHSNSTRSTSSFAFPILATEWSESPARMTQVETRKPRTSQRNTCWRMCFACSHF